MDIILKYSKLIAALLEMASSQFANHGCNDFDITELVPNAEDRRELARLFHEYNGDPEEYESDSDYEVMHDDALMGFFARQFLAIHSKQNDSDAK